MKLSKDQKVGVILGAIWGGLAIMFADARLTNPSAFTLSYRHILNIPAYLPYYLFKSIITCSYDCYLTLVAFPFYYASIILIGVILGFFVYPFVKRRLFR